MKMIATSAARPFWEARPDRLGDALKNQRKRRRSRNRRTYMGHKTNKSATGVVNRPKVVIERTYRAEVNELWDLWTTKDGFESWWGPQGFRRSRGGGSDGGDGAAGIARDARKVRRVRSAPAACDHSRDRLPPGREARAAVRTERLLGASYCASIHLSDPASLTATFEKDTRTGAPSAVPRWSVEKRSGPAFL